jgi:hypothetical protein
MMVLVFCLRSCMRSFIERLHGLAYTVLMPTCLNEISFLFHLSS